jgi:hypothetical protein
MDFSEEKAGGWALDFREAKPEWLNNLDKDKQYADWGNSVRLLLQPYFPGMIRPIARNLFTIVRLPGPCQAIPLIQVCFLDPAAPESRPILRSLLSLYAHNVPLRIGFLFVTNDSATASGKDDLGIGLFNAFQFVKAEKSAPKALHFLQRVGRPFGPGMTGLASFFADFRRVWRLPGPVQVAPVLPASLLRPGAGRGVRAGLGLRRAWTGRGDGLLPPQRAQAVAGPARQRSPPGPFRA